MIRCRDCGASQLEGVLYCSECGRSLLLDQRQATDVLPFSEFAHKAPPPPIAAPEITKPAQATPITFMVPSSRNRYTLLLQDEIKIGRESGSASEKNLDLSEDNGTELGVSRNHALLQWSNQGIIIMDVGSTNGTFLNNHHLPTHKPYPLQSGDELRFGELLVHVFF